MQKRESLYQGERPSLMPMAHPPLAPLPLPTATARITAATSRCRLHHTAAAARITAACTAPRQPHPPLPTAAAAATCTAATASFRCRIHHCRRSHHCRRLPLPLASPPPLDSLPLARTTAAACALTHEPPCHHVDTRTTAAARSAVTARSTAAVRTAAASRSCDLHSSRRHFRCCFPQLRLA
jgi:hypothetical protein